MNESLALYTRRPKKADRERLSQLSPEISQAEVEAVLNASAWKIKHESQLAWPGDLADDDETLWFAGRIDGEGIANGT